MEGGHRDELADWKAMRLKLGSKLQARQCHPNALCLLLLICEKIFTYIVDGRWNGTDSPQAAK